MYTLRTNNNLKMITNALFTIKLYTGDKLFSIEKNFHIKHSNVVCFRAHFILNLLAWLFWICIITLSIELQFTSQLLQYDIFQKQAFIKCILNCRQFIRLWVFTCTIVVLFAIFTSFCLSHNNRFIVRIRITDSR